MMRDYAELVKGLRDCSRRNARVCMICGAKASNLCEGTKSKRMFYAADAIEELLSESADLVGQVKRSQEEIRKLDKLLTAVPHWISVEERLPEESGRTIVYLREPNGIRHVSFATYQKTNGVWDLKNIRRWWHVTHWMPLPEPPKEVE